MTKYKNINIDNGLGGIGIRFPEFDTKPEPRQLWRDYDYPVSNPQECQEDWHTLWRKWVAFRKTLPSGTQNGYVSPISWDEAHEISIGRFRPLTVEDLRNPNNTKICDKFADEINTFLKNWSSK